MINIQGLLKTTLLDFPGHVASTVFLGGCNMRCPFCHNADIIDGTLPCKYTLEEVLGFLDKRQSIIEGVCITGGEPTIYSDLPDLIRAIKDKGFLVKLDTNGTNPGMIGTLMEEGLTDYIAMDIKSSIPGYGRASGISGIDTSAIRESISLLINGNCDYEFRSTVADELFDDTDIKQIGEMLAGATRYFLQGYVESDFVPDKTLHAADKEKLLRYRQELLKTIRSVELRGYD